MTLIFHNTLTKEVNYVNSITKNIINKANTTQSIALVAKAYGIITFKTDLIIEEI